MASLTIQDARKRIREVRTREVELFVLKDGKPQENAKVSFRMKNHQFLFGAVCYMYGKYDKPEMNELFTREFIKLFNYTMVPYHWDWYEPVKGQYAEPYTGNLVDWADRNRLKKKLHALIWHECCPEWIREGDDVERLYQERISHLMQLYGDRFDFFDVANETTVNDRFENPVSHWIRKAGPMRMLKFGTELVRSYRPDAKLVYGDWNVHVDAYYDFLGEMRENQIDIDLLGLQSHMHSDRWTQEETLRVMDKAAAFGWPLHFPECSICSGVPAGEMHFGAGARNEFLEKEEDLYSQAEYARDFYTLVFSHPAVEALSWFDFTDHRWLNAPSGVVTDKLEIKPVYETLYDLIHREWHSDADCLTNGEGMARARLFFGDYEITVQLEGEAPKTVSRRLDRPSFYAGGNGPKRMSVVLDSAILE